MSSTTVVLDACQARNDSGSLTPSFTGLVTSVWEHTKHGRLANFTPADTAELRSVLIEEFHRIHRKRELLSAFIRHAGVPIRLRC